MVGPHDLLPSALLLRHEGGALQYRNMLLYGGETHGVVLGKPGHRVLTGRYPGDDVPARGIGERLEQAVKVRIPKLIYNHLVVE